MRIIPSKDSLPTPPSKIAADKMTRSLLPFLRSSRHDREGPFNTYGPRQSAWAVIPTIIAQALVDERIRLGTVQTTRDFNFVSDTVEDLSPISASEEKAMGEVINLGSRLKYRFAIWPSQLGELLGKQLILETDRAPAPPAHEGSEVNRLCANAAKLLSYSPGSRRQPWKQDCARLLNG